MAKKLSTNTKLEHIVSDALHAGFYMAVAGGEDTAVLEAPLYASLADLVKGMDDFSEYPRRVIHVSRAVTRDATVDSARAWVSANEDRLIENCIGDEGGVTLPDAHHRHARRSI